MGFIVILPFAALAFWAPFAVRRWVWRPPFDAAWRRYYWRLFALGVLVGLWFANGLSYHVAKKRIDGFPIPVGIADPLENGGWQPDQMPPSVHWSARVTDVACGVAACLAPLAVAAFFKENTGRDEHGRPKF